MPEVAYHVIPVPHGWSPEQAWEAIGRGDVLTDPEPMWASVRVEDGRFVGLLAMDEDAAMRVEVVYYRHFVLCVERFGSIEEAVGFMEFGLDEGGISPVGVYVDGEPYSWGAYVERDALTPEQAETMRDAYAKAHAIQRGTSEQQATIERLLRDEGDFHVQPPLANGSLELRRDGKHLCFVLPDGSVVPDDGQEAQS